MGMLGQYLKEAREAKGVDLHDAAQETRISIHFLKALEEEDFSRLPGEVFVKGFLKSYAQYLRLPDHEVLERYREMKPKAPAAPGSSPEGEQKGPVCEQTPRAEMSLEPIIWGALLFIGLLVFLFTALPGGHDAALPTGTAVPAGTTGTTGTAAPEKSPGAPLYLKILAVDDVWVLVRTDASPQKKALLKKGETITWSAENRFLLSFGKVGSVQLFLNERELTVEGPREAAVRDLTITSAGIEIRTLRTEQVQKPKPTAPPQPKPAPSPAGGTAEAPPPAAAPEQQPKPKPAPSPQAAPAEPKPAPATASDNL